MVGWEGLPDLGMGVIVAETSTETRKGVKNTGQLFQACCKKRIVAQKYNLG